MTSIFMKRFGEALTGRPFGSQSYQELKQEVQDEVVQLDFAGVIALGSSFGEEVIVPIATAQDHRMTIKSAIAPVRSCIDLIAEDFKIEITYEP